MFSPMEQYIIYPLFNIELTLTNISLYLIIATILTISISLVNRERIISNNWGIISESFYRTLLNMLENFVGKKYIIYLPLFYSLFNLILFSNFLGLIPYSTTATTEIILTLFISFSLLIGFLLLGFLTHKLYLLSIFLPTGTPIALIPLMICLEIIAYLSRTLSLGLRLAINLIVGHCLVKVLIGFIWTGYLKGINLGLLSIGLLIISVFLCLEVLVCYLQCYIFIFIALLTLKDVSMEH